MAYSDKVLDHYENPRNVGSFDKDDASVAIKNAAIAEKLALPPVKIHCSILAEDAIKAAVAHYHCKHAAGASIEFSDAAAAKVGELIAEDGNPDLKLRISVSGGGCAGFQYGFAFDDTIADDDFRIDKKGVTLLIDAISMQYLAGAEVTYEDELQGARFVIQNLTASSICGCGSSFSV